MSWIQPRNPLYKVAHSVLSYLEQAVIATTVNVVVIYCTSIAGTLTHDQANPWEQENKRLHVA